LIEIREIALQHPVASDIYLFPNLQQVTTMFHHHTPKKKRERMKLV
jgi:hypothetical protein